jgi:poly(hydroxyalkanoate) depolymerase family esterase
MRRRIVLITLAAVGAVGGVAVGIASTSRSWAPSARHIHYASLVVGGERYPFAVYVPSTYRAGSAVPLVVVVHGCNTTADQQAAATGYDALAERSRFVVLYPDVDSVDEGQGRCWKGIWDPGAEGRGRGDAGAIAGMTRAVMARWQIDRSRVYAIGISAGGFETSILGAVYPDLYAAIGIHSGAAYMGGERGCLGGDESSATTSLLSRTAFAAMGSRARVMPVIVFHGDADHTVPERCGQQAIAQWLRTDDLILEHERRAVLPSVPSISDAAVPRGHAYRIASYVDTLGCVVAQLWTIHGMGHYWSGGSADPASWQYSDPRGPSAAVTSWAFFSRWRLAGPVGRCARPRQ